MKATQQWWDDGLRVAALVAQHPGKHRRWYMQRVGLSWKGDRTEIAFIVVLRKWGMIAPSVDRSGKLFPPDRPPKTDRVLSVFGRPRKPPGVTTKAENHPKGTSVAQELQMIAAYVRKHPGCSAVEVWRALGLKGQRGWFIWKARQKGLLAPADPDQYGHLYPLGWASSGP